MSQLSFSFELTYGEILLRGTLVKAGNNFHLILNPKSRNMKVLDLAVKDLEGLKKYDSGVNVEVCVDLKIEKKKSNIQSELLNIRPLAPGEAIILYSQTVKSCPPGRGCRNFGIPLEASAFSEFISLDYLPYDYFSCKP